MNNKKLTISIIASLGILAIGGGSFYYYHNKSNELTDKQKTEIRNQIYEYSTDNEQGLKGLNTLVEKNISQFPMQERDNIIDNYIQKTYKFSTELSQKLSNVGFELEKVVKDFKVDVSNPKTYKNIPDSHAMVRGFLEELHFEGFTLEHNGEYYTVVSDLNQVIEKFGKLLSNSYKEYLEFNSYELSHVNIIDSKQEVNLDEVATRITMLEKGLKTDEKQNYEFAYLWTSSLQYYYSVLFGLNNTSLVSNDFFKADVLKKYEELANKNKDTTLGNNITKALKVIKDNNNKMDEKTKKGLSEIVNSIYNDKIKQSINSKYPNTFPNTPQK